MSGQCARNRPSDSEDRAAAGAAAPSVAPDPQEALHLAEGVPFVPEAGLALVRDAAEARARVVEGDVVELRRPGSRRGAPGAVLARDERRRRGR